jgi:hypothetical protein
MMFAVLVCTSLSLLADGPVIDASRFGQVMRGLHSQTRDVTFAYEGGLRTGDGARMAGVGPNEGAFDFQGRYSHRSDGAELLDLYERGLKLDDHQSHELIQNLGGTSSVRVIPDLKRLVPRSPPASSKSKSSHPIRPTPIAIPGSPCRIYYVWLFHGLTDPGSMRYEFQGWEEVDGRRCLRVELDSDLTGAPEDRDRLRMWIDLDRGGHPLKVEVYRQGILGLRVQNVKLQQFPDPTGALVWLPVSSELGSFLWLSKAEKKLVSHSAPVFVETYATVAGSVVLNKGLSDSDLSIGTSAVKYTEFGGFKGFEKKERQPTVRTDPEGVQKRLDAALAEADSKAARLEASAPERSFWNSPSNVSIGLLFLGVIVICAAGVWKLRWEGR